MTEENLNRTEAEQSAGLREELKELKSSVSDASEKLQKVLAEAGLGSRRAMEGWIEEGRVRVNGKLARLGLRVTPQDSISVDGQELRRLTFEERVPRVLLYHKPEGEIVSRNDPEGRPTVFDHLPPLENGRWIAVGRLDFNTEGLLLFTSSGELANLLMHPRYEIEREYMARVSGRLSDEAGEQLVRGVELEDGLASFQHISDQGGTDINHWYLVRLSEGRNREVRRMFEAVGLKVGRLIRVRFDSIELPESMRRGDIRELDRHWVQRWIESLETGNGRKKSAPEKRVRRAPVTSGYASSRRAEERRKNSSGFGRGASRQTDGQPRRAHAGRQGRGERR